MEDIFSTIGGLFFKVSNREFGFQDKGESPKGAQDQLSFNIAYNLLGKPCDFQAVEMVYPGKIVANKNLMIVLCGSSYQVTRIDCKDIKYNQVTKFSQGEILEFAGAKKGFRTIILAIPITNKKACFLGKTRSSELEKFINQNYRDNFIRVIKGPEYSILKDNIFFESTWNLSPNSSQMGISFDGPNINSEKIEMISQPVTDGTIQLSPSGPIVLMRHRQTVGGYPRIANVTEVDISKLSQFSPGAKLRFKLISLNEAIEKDNEFKMLLKNS